VEFKRVVRVAVNFLLQDGSGWEGGGGGKRPRANARLHHTHIFPPSSINNFSRNLPRTC